MTGDAWASDYKADLDRKFVNEREELRSKMQQEHEALQQRLRLSDKNSSDTAQQKWDGIEREMTEKFNQQRREYQGDFSRKNAESMEEYRKNCNTTWHASLAQEMEKSRKARGKFPQSGSRPQGCIDGRLNSTRSTPRRAR